MKRRLRSLAQAIAQPPGGRRPRVSELVALADALLDDNAEHVACGQTIDARGGRDRRGGRASGDEPSASCWCPHVKLLLDHE